PGVAGLALEPVDEIDDIVEAATGARSNAASGDGDRQVGFAGAGSANQHGIALLGEESAAGCADSARALRQGEDDPEDRAGPRGVPEHGPQGVAIRGDVVRVRAHSPTAAEAGTMDCCDR